VRSIADLYDWELRHVHHRVDGDVPFYAALAVAAGPGPVLELACGTGRVASRLPRPVVGLDLDPGMLAVARRRGVGHVVCADMRRLAFGPAARFGLVAIPYNSLQLLDEDGMVDCLRGAAACLAPGGVVAFEVTDFGAPAPVPPEVLASADGVTLIGSLEVGAGGVLHYRRRFIEGSESREDVVSIRPLGVPALTAVVAAAGLRIEALQYDGKGVRATTIRA
jgi:SAM-dependent methyltransferase